MVHADTGQASPQCPRLGRGLCPFVAARDIFTQDNASMSGRARRLLADFRFFVADAALTI